VVVFSNQSNREPPDRQLAPYGCGVLEIVRCGSEGDKELSLAVYNAVWPHDAITMDEVRSFEASLVAHGNFIARVDGEPAGSGYGAIGPWLPDVVFVLLTVLPDKRGLGAGNGLYAAVSDWASERGLETLEAVVSDDDPVSLAFAERRGFVEHHREKGVALDLTRTDPPPVELPEGVEIATWAERPELDRGMYEVALEAYPDIPGGEDEQVEPFEDWLAHHMKGSGDLPEATFIAVADDEVVGWAKFSLTAARPKVASHDLTAVKRAWRGRGVARALKATQIGWAKANGYEELHTRNEERNAPIRHLNEEFGYEPAVGRIYLRGPLSTTTAGS
jgi:GNAT superfamily N-acetyltransferase